MPARAISTIKKYASAQHPLDQVNFLNKAFISWASYFAYIGNKTPWKQEYHPNLPTEDDIDRNLLMLKENYKDTSITRAILKTFKLQILKFIGLGTLHMMCDSGSSLILLSLTRYTEDASKLLPEDRDVWDLIPYFCGILVLQMFSSILSNYSQISLKRLSLRIQASLESMIYDKILMFSVLNPSDHDEGSISNYVNVDAPKVKDALEQFVWVFEGALTLCFCMVFGFYFYDWKFAVCLGVFGLGVCVTSLFFKTF